MTSAIFWIAWGAISYWALRNFYYSFSQDKLRKLRQATISIEVAVLFSFLFNYRPASLGARTGLDLLLSGDLMIVALLILIVAAAILLSTDDSDKNKIGATLHISSSVYIFIALFHLWPGTVKIGIADSAPPIAILLLLTGNVSALLMWQQLQLKDKKKHS